MKIIRKGKVYRTECECCKTLFEYTDTDVDEYATVVCPCCGEVINHTKENEYSKS